jgi:hypothetical protein
MARSTALIHQDHNYAADPLSMSMSDPLEVPVHLPFFDNVNSSQAGHNYHDSVKPVRNNNVRISGQEMIEFPWQQPASAETGRENALVETDRDMNEHVIRYDY